MMLKPGTELAHYRLVERIGEGGMGQVWAAEDGKLQRKVALKVLPPELAADPERRTRFEREARAIAGLNHPHIVTIHSVEEADGTLFLTMELVRGRTLDALLPRGGFPLERFFEIFIPLCDAVGAAHDHGITHRDLKPANVMVDDDGRVKVLDFGLAKLRAAAAPDEWVTEGATSITRQGMILGTVAYMSPEQAEGRPVGTPSDVFSLGILLYEMISGERPFAGRSLLSTLSAILRDEPVPIHQRRAGLPRHLGRIIRRALTKDPGHRYATARELRNEMEALRDEVQAGEAEPPVRPGAPRWVLPAVAAAALAAGMASGLLLRPAAPAAGAARISFRQVTYDPGVETFPTLSPMGELVAYEARNAQGRDSIFLLRVGGANPIELTADMDAACSTPAYSRDGRFLAFRSEAGGGGVYMMGATGESVRRLTDSGFHPAWSPDGKQIAFSDERMADPLSRNSVSALRVVDVESGVVRKIYDGDAVQPSWSPNGKRIAYWTFHPGEQDAGHRDVETIRPDGTGRVAVTRDMAVDWNPVWSGDGRYLYFASDRDGSMNVWRVPIDEESGLPRGEPERIATPSAWSGPFAIAAVGETLVYSAHSERSGILKLDLGAAGDPAGPAVPVTRGSLLALDPAVSPDGQWVAFRSRGWQEDIYLVRPDGTGLRKLTDDLYKDRGPAFTRDGRRVVFYSNRSGKYEIWSVDVDGSAPRQVTDMPGFDLYWPRYSPDGRRLLSSGPQGGFWFDAGEGLLGPEQAHEFPPVDETGAAFVPTDWSPDGAEVVGRQVAKDDGASALLLEYNLKTGVYRSRDVGHIHAPRWHPDGRHLLSQVGGRVYSLDRETGRERILVEDRLDAEASVLALAADGGSLYYVRSTVEADLWLARTQE